MARRAVGANARDDGEHDILRSDARSEMSVDGNAHALGLALPQRVRHQHMGNFGGADAESEGPERAMGRGVAVAAHDQQAGQGKTLLWSHHVDDSLAGIIEPEYLYPMLGGVFFERTHHARDLGIVDDAPRAARRDVVIGDSEGEAWLGDSRAARLDLAEGVERSFMHVMAVDP